MRANIRRLTQPSLFIHAFAIIKETLSKLVNGFFGYSRPAAQRRRSVRSVAFLGVFAFFAIAEFQRNPTAMQHYQSWRDALSRGGLLIGLLSPEFFTFLQAALRVSISLSVLRELLVIFVPYLLALEFAAIYQHDIFERETDITRTFINQAMFAAHYSVIHVKDGRVVPEDEDSPILQIGGPGLVEVELDSAIMLEDADHNPRIIGPTGRSYGGMEVLSGFERIRQSFDLRERSVTIQSITARSRDGIMVEAKDLHYVFSVNRGDTPPTREIPYPFEPNSLNNFVYNGPPKVQGWKSPIATDMNGPLTMELSGFITNHFIGEFLASIGQPELETYEARQRARNEAARNLAEESQPAEPEAFPKQGEFTSRTAISDQLNSENFRNSVRSKGFTSRWVGVGTWNTAAKAIPELHLEAWQTSRGNVVRGSDGELNKVRTNARYDHLLELISQVVLDPYYEHMNEAESVALVNRWLNTYEERLLALRETFQKEQQPVPAALTTALNILAEVRTYHSVDVESDDEE